MVDLPPDFLDGDLAVTDPELMAWVLDDDESCARTWARELETGAKSAGVGVSAKPIYGTALHDVIDDLNERHRAFRSGGGTPNPSGLDECDVLVIDADLREAANILLATGQDLAYSARCFSDVGVIVVLNAYGDDPFDLRLTGSQYRRSFADLHLGSRQIGNSRLWSLPVDGTEGFRPWSWPLLGDEVSRQAARLSELSEEGGLETRIAALLGFEDSDIQAVPRSSAAFITAELEASNSDLGRITAGEFATRSEQALQRRDAQAAARDLDGNRIVIARVAAARIARWIDSILAPAQDVLADAPHLALRYPSQVEDTTQAGLNQTIRLDVASDPPRVHQDRGLQAETLSGFYFDKPQWASRPLWWARRLSTSSLPEVEKPWEVKSPDFVFCEDDSTFRVPSDAQTFACDLDTPYRIRHVWNRYDDVVYRPRENFIVDD